MILWTPMQLELVMEGLEDMSVPKTEQVVCQGVSMLVEKTNDGQQKIVRLLSTNPADYLKEECFPGRNVTTC